MRCQVNIRFEAQSVNPKPKYICYYTCGLSINGHNRGKDYRYNIMGLNIMEEIEGLKYHEIIINEILKNRHDDDGQNHKLVIYDLEVEYNEEESLNQKEIYQRYHKETED